MSGAFPPSLDIPDEVLRIARSLADAGHEVWAVGGAVRDNLLDYPNNDFDLATSATPQEVRRLFRRTVPVGIEHGTVAVLDRAGKPHEVTTFRRDVKTDGRHAVVEFGVSLDDDLARRDFTINAIAYHPLTGEWRDPFAGAADLEAKLVRAVGEPRQRFREDYLRILRSLRFAARFGFEIDGPTWEAARVEIGGLQHLSAERVRDEWFKGLATAGSPVRLIELWRDVGALEGWMPEMRGEGSADAAGSASTHARPSRLTRFPRDPVLITAFLSRDPETTLRRFKCSNAEVERGRRIAEHRGSRPDAANDVAVRSWLAAVGPAADDLVAVAEAEGRGGALRAAVNRVRASGAPLTLGDVAVTGDDLLALGVPRGPEVGRILRELLDHVLAHPDANDRDALLARVTHRLSAQRSPLTGGAEGGGE